MLTAELLLRWKEAFRKVLPVLLALDMVHSIHYVAGLYQDRLKEWEKEDFAETSSEVFAAMYHVVQHCQHRDQLIWPTAVTTAVESAFGSRAPVGGDVLPDEHAISSNQGNATEHAPTDNVLEASAEHDAFVQLGIISSMEPAAGRSNLQGTPGNARRVQVDSHDAERVPPIRMYLNTLWSLLPEWGRTRMAKLSIPVHQHSGTSQSHQDTAMAESATFAIPLNPVRIENKDALTGTSHYSRTQDWLEKSVRTKLDCLPKFVQRQGCPWPCMNVTRRSALRWKIDWHGLQWPPKQQAAQEVTWDEYY